MSFCWRAAGKRQAVPFPLFPPRRRPITALCCAIPTILNFR
ncbi:MAG: hypothetical protein ACFNS8_05205 [Kingella oralis]